jgi:hypothetical protein
MTAPAAFRATYSDMKLIKTRKCVQLVFEIPLEHYKAAEQVLGGLPDPAAERWFGIAPLRADLGAPEKPAEAPAPAKAKKDWRDLPPSQQAAIRCGEPIFWAFLREVHHYEPANAVDAAEAVREVCNVESRTAFNSDQRARVLWHQLDSQFQAWKVAEGVRA